MPDEETRTFAEAMRNYIDRGASTFIIHCNGKTINRYKVPWVFEPNHLIQS